MKFIGLICLFVSFGFIQQAKAGDCFCQQYSMATYLTHCQFNNDSNWRSGGTGCPNCETDGWTESSKDSGPYYGFRDGNNQSPYGGRNQAAYARLDVCFSGGQQNTSGFTDASSCYQACDNVYTANTICFETTNSDPFGDCWTRCDAVDWNSNH